MPNRLTLLVLPIVLTVLVVGLGQAWTMYQADDTTVAVLLATGVVAVGLGTLLAARRIGQGLASRIARVSSAAQRVASRDMAVLLDALRNPDQETAGVGLRALDASAGDEIGELARSFNGLQGALIDVGSRQMEAMKAGIAGTFVTLARRNSTLVDRQIALLDELESREEDPQALGRFYQLDHLATRIRRNAESLLVLAGSESPRVWAKARDMSDVVRAAVGEVDEYQRIDVLALEPARLSADAVSDISHLLAELLENAVQFSPPDQDIRVTGLFDTAGYQVSIADRGVGMPEARIAELNRILDRPPALGLSVDATLGMYVVAKLAARHRLEVELVNGVPGITARVTIPRDRLEATKESRRLEVDAAPAPLPQPLPEPARERIDSVQQVVDLTDPVYAENSDGELPVRTPGSALPDDVDEVSNASSGVSDSRIQSALAAYEVGRNRAASRSAQEAIIDRDASESEPR